MVSSLEPRRRLVGFSAKMYFTAPRTEEYTQTLVDLLQGVPLETLQNIDIFILPDYITIPGTIKQLENSPVPVWTGAQDCHWEDQGAFTGEVSPATLKHIGARLVAVGHAERRRLFAEDDEMVAKKAAAVARNGMLPLVCIGEKTQGDVSIAVDECTQQIDVVVAAVQSDAEIALAYEPVWAIGAPQPASEDYILAVVEKLRNLPSIVGRKGITRIVYGGSAGPGLFKKLKDGLDGLFLGRFAHDPEQFVQTGKEVAEA
ncbi:hypothetical protein VHEMI00234 [[Torrubiella] hemipterigena]|uniref:Triosephosphate isomerase n=1 Tax=[Torrubiella] hemipterigena TaxID=1531966 RepID=A0A0A1T1B8_9HYPO|nr:hypothetical protein VHEMI00234 [[Torrubiella] hemipterigena]